MPRRPLEPGSHGDITITAQRKVGDNRYRARAEGDTRKPDRWRATARVMDLDGKVHQVTRFSTRRGSDAERAVEDALRVWTAPVKEATITPDTTIAELATAWVEHIGTIGEHSKSTVRLYSITANKHVLNRDGAPGDIASLRLRQVTPASIDRALRAVLDSGKGTGTVKTLRTVYRSMFDLAIQHRAVTANPVREVSAIKPPRNDSDEDASGYRTFLNVEEAEHLIAVADEQDRASVAKGDKHSRARSRDMGDLVAFMASTGVRIGEAAAVRWSDVNFRTGTVKVGGWTVTRIKGEGLARVRHGSTKHGTREVALPESMLDRLRARRQRLPRNKHDVIFPAAGMRADGKGERGLRDPSNTNKHFRELLDAAGLQDVRGSHIFRKTVATLMHLDGASDREIANQLGHRNISTTMNTYVSSATVSERTRTLLNLDPNRLDSAQEVE